MARKKSVEKLKSRKIVRVDNGATVDAYSLFSDTAFHAHFEDAAFRSRLLATLLETRVRLGLTQSFVAEIMGTTQSAISELESGATDPRLSTLQRYARAVKSQIYLDILTPFESTFSWFSVNQLNYVFNLALDFESVGGVTVKQIMGDHFLASPLPDISYVRVDSFKFGVIENQMSTK